MKKKVLFFIFLLLFIPFVRAKALDVTYESHVQLKGWMEPVSLGETTGTTGQGLRMEAIKINLNDESIEGEIKYQVHVQNKGWMDWVSDGELAGTTGQGLRMEAIKIQLTGDLEKKYKVAYRTHVQYRGWMDWQSDGEISGTTGQGLRIEALEVKLIEREAVELSYQSHSNDGWQDYVKNGEMSGTTGQGLSLDQIKIDLKNNTDYSGDISYSIYNADSWSDFKSSTEAAGIENIPIEAVKIRLTDELSENYNIFYRVHASYIGWMGWTSNGEVAGTVGYLNKIEAIEIKILDKTESSLVNESNASKIGDNSIKYSSHVQNIGWQDYVPDEEISGTTGQRLRLEAFKVKLSSVLSGGIKYKAYVEKKGWSEEVSSDSISGTTGQGRTLEAISIRLDGVISENYDIYYRTHMSRIGWLSWAKNGDYSGCTNSSTKIEAIQIKLVRKNSSIELDTSRSFVTGSWQNRDLNYYDYFGELATGFKFIDGQKCYFNPEGTLYAKNVNKVIDVSTWQDYIDWDTIKKKGDVDAAIIRVGWGTDDDVPCGTDGWFDRNIKEVQRLGIPYGIYIYAYANDNEHAVREADFVVSKMKEYNIPKDTWVWYDAEIKSIPRSSYNTIIPTFINRVKQSGYKNVGVYSGVSQLDTTNGNTNTDTIRSYPIWVAQYYKHLQYTGNYVGWQFSSTEYIDGINGYVDVSMFKK